MQKYAKSTVVLIPCTFPYRLILSKAPRQSQPENKDFVSSNLKTSTSAISWLLGLALHRTHLAQRHELHLTPEMQRTVHKRCLVIIKTHEGPACPTKNVRFVPDYWIEAQNCSHLIRFLNWTMHRGFYGKGTYS